MTTPDDKSSIKQKDHTKYAVILAWANLQIIKKSMTRSYCMLSREQITAQL